MRSWVRRKRTKTARIDDGSHHHQRWGRFGVLSVTGPPFSGTPSASLSGDRQIKTNTIIHLKGSSQPSIILSEHHFEDTISLSEAVLTAVSPVHLLCPYYRPLRSDVSPPELHKQHLALDPIPLFYWFSGIRQIIFLLGT